MSDASTVHASSSSLLFGIHTTTVRSRHCNTESSVLSKEVGEVVGVVVVEDDDVVVGMVPLAVTALLADEARTRGGPSNRESRRSSLSKSTFETVGLGWRWERPDTTTRGRIQCPSSLTSTR